MRLVKHFIPFCNKFIKFNNTGAGMFDSIYHRILTLINIAFFGVKMTRFCHLLRNILMDVII